MRYLDIENSVEHSCKKGHHRGIYAIAISQCALGTQPLICSSSRDGSVVMWQPDRAEKARVVVPAIANITAMAIYHHGATVYLILGAKDGIITIFDLAVDKLGEPIKVLMGHRASVQCVVVTTLESEEQDLRHKSRLIICSASKDRTVRVWDFASGRRQHKLEHNRAINTIAVTSKSTINPVLVSAGTEKLIFLWDIKTGVLLRSLAGHTGKIYSLAIFEGDELLLISAGEDRTIRVFDALSGELLCTLVGHQRVVQQIVLHTAYETLPPQEGDEEGVIYEEERTKIVSCSKDRTWRIWDMDAIVSEFYYPLDEGDEAAGGGRNLNNAFNPEAISAGEYDDKSDDDDDDDGHDMYQFEDKQTHVSNVQVPQPDVDDEMDSGDEMFAFDDDEHDKANELSTVSPTTIPADPPRKLSSVRRMSNFMQTLGKMMVGSKITPAQADHPESAGDHLGEKDTSADAGWHDKKEADLVQQKFAVALAEEELKSSAAKTQSRIRLANRLSEKKGDLSGIMPSASKVTPLPGIECTVGDGVNDDGPLETLIAAKKRKEHEISGARHSVVMKAAQQNSSLRLQKRLGL